jgi:hypothetical protein
MRALAAVTVSNTMLKIEGKTLSWAFEERDFKKEFDGNVFYADPLNCTNSKFFIIVARAEVGGKDSFLILDGTGNVNRNIYIPESFPAISSLYAVDKSTSNYEVIVRSEESKSGRDLAFRFNIETGEFNSWRESW